MQKIGQLALLSSRDSSARMSFCSAHLGKSLPLGAAQRARVVRLSAGPKLSDSEELGGVQQANSDCVLTFDGRQTERGNSSTQYPFK